MTSNLHLLIVEDVLADVELMTIALATANITFTYDSTDTLGDCQQLLQTQTYDAVLADYRLPQFTAYEVLKVLQQSEQEIPLILVTGSLGEEAAVECIKAGMTDYVLKERLFRLPMVLRRSLQEFELRHQQQAAVAQIQRQAQQQAIINRILQAMRETLVLSEVLQTTADLLHEALDVSRCLIFHVGIQDQCDQVIVDYVSQDSPGRENLIGKSFGSHQHYREALAVGSPVAQAQIDASLPADIQELARQYAVRAFIIAPLLYQQSYFGGISLHQCDRERQWTVDEISLVKAISDQCAIAIHQAQLFHRVEQQALRERTLNQISQALNSSLDPQYILQEIVKLTGKCFDVDRVTIFSINAEHLQVITEWRASDQVVSVLGFTATQSEYLDLLNPASDFSLLRPFQTQNYAEVPLTPSRQQQIQQAQVLSSLRVPIFIRDQLFGGLVLHTITNYRTFTQDEIHLLERIANQTAIALYNAQSYERLEELVKQRTQELEAEKLLSDAANQAKSDFLSNISHELRTPLTGILGFSGILLEQIFGSLNAKQKQYLEGIHASGKHLLELINDLLDLTKIEAGKEDLSLDTIFVEELGQTCLSLFQQRCLQKGLQLSLKIAPNVTTCIADQRRLKQILVNLLANAIKFTDSGSVTLKIEQTAEEIQFAVIDTGIGIAQADQEQIFQPFHQLDSGLNRKYEGTGLGLALSRKLARLHHGDITLQSELGRGSCFTLYLPRKAAGEGQWF